MSTWKVEDRSTSGVSYGCTEGLDKDRYPLVINIPAGGFALGSVGAIIPWDSWGGNHEANARLMAAAPDLLEALKRAQRFIARVDDLHQNIYVSGLDDECQAAIAKAEGK